MTQPGHKCPGWEVSVSVSTPMIAEHVAARFDLSRRINRDRCDDSCEHVTDSKELSMVAGS
jgi:hypothetical protein